ncbi:MAG: hypothetical protein CVU97_07355 [Firmicutes bacterium HGW-Firmicutes-21]|nr:MAG: hypothetical protein CVU97_07355 [Firmicutes bacterium HGW-Firmicutes-21]
MRSLINKSFIPLFLILCLLLATGCSDKNIGDKTTEPLDRLINGLLKKDTALYKSAFPPDYIDRATNAFDAIGNDIDKVLSELFTDALDAHIVNYGEKTRINYTLISKEELSSGDLDKYWDLIVNGYDLPVDKITEAYRATVDVTVKGRDSEVTKRAEYKLLHIDGVWYLHPEVFMNVFSG